MAQEHSIRLKIDAAAAETGAKRFKGAIESVKRAVQGLERATDGSFKNLKRSLNIPAGGTTERALKGTATAAKTVETAAKRLATSAKNDVTSATSSIAKLVNQFAAVGDTSGIKRAEQALTRLTAKANAAGSVTDLGAVRADHRASVAGLKAEADAQTKAARAAQLHATDIERLAKKYSPATSAAALFEKQLVEVNRAESLGVITAEEATQARLKANAALAQGANHMDRFGRTATVSSGHIGNISAQMTDVAVMLNNPSASPFQIALFQGTQLSAVLNQIAAKGGGGVLSALKAGFTQMLNPISLITIAAIAAGAALFNAFRNAQPETKSFADALKDTESALAAAKTAAALARGSLKALGEEYGDTAGDVRGLAEALAATQIAKATRELRTLRETIYEDATGEEWWRTMFTFGNNTSDAAKEVGAIRRELGLTAKEAAKLRQNLIDALKTTDAREGVRLYEQIREQLILSAGGVGKMSDEMLSFVERIAKAEATSRQLAALDISSPAGRAADEARRFADNLGEALVISETLGRNIVKAGVKDGSIPPWAMGDLPQTDADKAWQSILEERRRKARQPDKKRGGSNHIDEIARTTQSLQEQILAETALRESKFESTEAANLWAQAMVDGNGSVDAQTASMLAQVEALALHKKALREAPETFAKSIGEGTENALENAIRNGLSGNKVSILDFGKAIQGEVAGAFAKGISKKIVGGLGLDRLFDMGAAASGATIGSSMISASATGAAMFAQAISTGSVAASAASAGGGGFLSMISGFFGFDEGVANVSNPAPWQRVPQYAEGTANTSGIPALLHDNEAVIPLSRGRKVPVEMSGAGGGGVTIGDIHTNVTVEDNGEEGAEQAMKIAAAVEETVVGIVETKIAEGMAYGGIMNPRGGA